MLGQRLRHLRKAAGLTLDELGSRIGRPPSYLSQLENGHREPRLTTLDALAGALGVGLSELLDSRPPSRRAELEVELARFQEEPAYRALRLPHLRPSARLDDVALEHVVALYRRLQDAQAAPGRPGAAAGGAREANAAMRDEMRRRDNYFGEIERAAGEALAAVGYSGPGAISERHLTDLASWYGFRIARVQDLPSSTRSVTDQRDRVIYVPQRNNATVRATRSVIAQTLGHFALGHGDPVDFGAYVRQRVEANYFAGALLAPEAAVVAMLTEAKARRDLSVEDLNEVFYISYEMAAHRLTNLVTRHLDIPVHFQRCDPDGLLWKAYENDGVSLPADTDGTIEGQRVCRWWSTRQAFESEDSFAMYYQYTETLTGTFWCATHVEADPGRGDAVTVGTTEANARWWRGADTTRRGVSRCPEPSCCREPTGEQRERWAGRCWPSARDHSQFVSGLPTDTVVFDPYPGVDLVDVYGFLDRRRS